MLRQELIDEGREPDWVEGMLSGACTAQRDGRSFVPPTSGRVPSRRVRMPSPDGCPLGLVWCDEAQAAKDRNHTRTSLLKNLGLPPSSVDKFLDLQFGPETDEDRENIRRSPVFATQINFSYFTPAMTVERENLHQRILENSVSHENNETGIKLLLDDLFGPESAESRRMRKPGPDIMRIFEICFSQFHTYAPPARYGTLLGFSPRGGSSLSGGSNPFGGSVGGLGSSQGGSNLSRGFNPFGGSGGFGSSGCNPPGGFNASGMSNAFGGFNSPGMFTPSGVPLSHALANTLGLGVSIPPGAYDPFNDPMSSALSGPFNGPINDPFNDPFMGSVMTPSSRPRSRSRRRSRSRHRSRRHRSHRSSRRDSDYMYIDHSRRTVHVGDYYHNNLSHRFCLVVGRSTVGCRTILDWILAGMTESLNHHLDSGFHVRVSQLCTVRYPCAVKLLLITRGSSASRHQWTCTSNY